MSYTCPVSGQRIDSTIVRMISFEVAGVVLLLLLTHHILFASLLLFDFTARLFRKKECSPFLLAARILQKRLSFPVRMSDEAPKRFALYLGWSMAVSMMIFALIDLIEPEKHHTPDNKEECKNNLVFHNKNTISISTTRE